MTQPTSTPATAIAIAPPPLKPVDVWAMQHTLMAASGQRMPLLPEINTGVLLYSALNLEEGSEVLDGVVKALTRLSATESPESALLASIASQLQHAATTMHAASRQVRDTLKDMPKGWRANLERFELKEIADGNVDLMVTNAGLSLSLGVDGGACYEDVAGSNLSKRNPDDGKIHVDASGKWIKDPRTFREPTLLATIDRVADARKGPAAPAA